MLINTDSDSDLGLLNSGRLTYTKYVEMKSRHHAKMRQKLLDNEIEYYSFDTDVFGKLDKLILVEIEIIINKEKEEAERVKSEREAKWLAEKASLLFIKTLKWGGGDKIKR